MNRIEFDPKRNKGQRPDSYPISSIPLKIETGRSLAAVILFSILQDHFFLGFLPELPPEDFPFFAFTEEDFLLSDLGSKF